MGKKCVFDEKIDYCSILIPCFSRAALKVENEILKSSSSYTI